MITKSVFPPSVPEDRRPADLFNSMKEKGKGGG